MQFLFENNKNTIYTFMSILIRHVIYGYGIFMGPSLMIIKCLVAFKSWECCTNLILF